MAMLLLCSWIATNGESIPYATNEKLSYGSTGSMAARASINDHKPTSLTILWRVRQVQATPLTLLNLPDTILT
jgi:hypothetical protein